MQELENTLKQDNFSFKLIFNFDETILNLSEHKVKVFMYTCNSCSFIENEIKLEHISLELYISTIGIYFRPLTILSLKNLSHSTFSLDRTVTSFLI
jgi:hypothetical protein